MLFVDAQNAGISGDMLIASLLDLGADVKRANEILKPAESLIGGFKIKSTKVSRGVYNATSYRFDFKRQDMEYPKVLEALEKTDLSGEAKKFALACFKTLTDAESRVHGVSKEDLHLHDAPDTVADFAIAAGFLDDLGILGDKVLSSHVNTGTGFFTFHGQRSTLPAPATTEILKGKPIFGNADMELTTPTGASILVNLADEFIDTFPLMKIEKVGYGAGYSDLDFPNVLKIYHGNSISKTNGDSVVLLESNLDSTTGETLGYLFERLFEEGALDVAVVPCVMKKNRPGHILKVLCKESDITAVENIITGETGTLGIRMIPQVHRHILKRETVNKSVVINGTKYTVRIKKSYSPDGKLIGEKPEFEDLKKIAKKTGLTLKSVEKHISKEGGDR